MGQVAASLKLKTLNDNPYSKLVYCDWKDEDTEESVKWDLHEVTQEIINDIENTVPTKLQEP